MVSVLLTDRVTPVNRCVAGSSPAGPVFPLLPPAPLRGVRPFVLEAAYFVDKGVHLLRQCYCIMHRCMCRQTAEYMAHQHRLTRFSVAGTLRCVAWAVRLKVSAVAPAVCEIYLLTFSYSGQQQPALGLTAMQLLQVIPCRS